MAAARAETTRGQGHNRRNSSVEAKAVDGRWGVPGTVRQYGRLPPPPTARPVKRWQGRTCCHRGSQENPTARTRTAAASGARGAERSDQGLQGLRDFDSHPRPDVQGLPVVHAGSDRGGSCGGPVDGPGGVHRFQGDERELRVLREVRKIAESLFVTRIPNIAAYYCVRRPAALRTMC